MSSRRSHDTSVVGCEEGGGSPEVLFDGLVHVQAKQLEREEICKQFGITISSGKGGANGLSKAVNVRLSDPRDPFFLFSMSLLEDDYGRFKEKHELLVDFNGFPNELVTMVADVAHGGTSPRRIVFVVDNKELGVLRFMEKTEFRSLEHLSLNMVRQGDAGQKKYLAEKFQLFEGLYYRCDLERKEDVLRAAQAVAVLKKELDTVKTQRDAVSEQLKLESSNANSTQLSTVARLKDQHAYDMKQLQSTFDAERIGFQHKIDVLLSQHAAENRVREQEVSNLKSSLQALEAQELTLRNQLRVSHDSSKTSAVELERFRRDNQELSSFRQSAVRSMSESELHTVATTERLKFLAENVKNREDEVKTLRNQCEKHDGISALLTQQFNAAQEKLKTSEASLSKAHHILSNQMNALRSAKEKCGFLQAQVQANEATLGEKNNTVERLRNEAITGSDRIEHLQHKVTELKDQLMKAEDHTQKLSSQLKQNEDALIHMQRMTSGFGTRTFSAAAAAPLSSHSASNMYRDFAKGTQRTVNTSINSYSVDGPVAEYYAQRPLSSGSTLETTPSSVQYGLDQQKSKTSFGISSFTIPGSTSIGLKSVPTNIYATQQVKPQVATTATIREPVSAYFPGQ